MTTKEFLQETRNLLEKTYVPWTRDDYKGGHCALGCMDEVASRFGYSGYKPALDLLTDCLVNRHPELVGVVRDRVDGYDQDVFNELPGSAVAFVNNQLGKEAILADIDAAIEGKCEPVPTPPFVEYGVPLKVYRGGVVISE